jgi:threonine dehydrogenase-like Zn-dependent dehydrogenase
VTSYFYFRLNISVLVVSDIAVMPSTMKAVVWSGKPYSVTVEKLPKPKIIDPLDVIVRLTTSGICGSDLHIYHGLLGSREPPWILGHEGIGIVTEIGQGVTGLRKGDRLVVSATPSCGHCDPCTKTLTSFCQTVNPPGEGAVFGVGPDYGKHLGGAQGKLRAIL